jgi:CheY-like chemotaxis protein
VKSKILLVDDNAAFIDTIKDILEDENYTVTTAHSGEAALFIAREQAFDFILMDIKMPGMNGFECFLRIKEHRPDVRAMLFTAYALNDLVRKARHNGVLAVLKKPLEIDQLLKMIAKGLNSNESHRTLAAEDDGAF